MSSGGFYNISLLQGDTYAETFVLRHKIIVSTDAVIGDDTLNVFPIPHGLTNGDVLTFGTVEVTLTASATANSSTLNVNAITGDIAKSTSAKSRFVDLTGKNARASIRQEFLAQSPLANFTCTIGTPATSGQVTLMLSSSTSAGIPANTTPGKARLISDLQSPTFPNSDELKNLFTVGLQPAPYYYDLEIYDSGSPPIVTKYIKGRVLVLAEATR